MICKAFGGRSGRGKATLYLQSSATTDARIDTQMKSNSGTWTSSLDCDRDRERFLPERKLFRKAEEENFGFALSTLS